MNNSSFHNEMDTMPDAVIIEIALHLDIQSITKLCQTDRTFNNLVCKNQYFWKLKCEKDFHIHISYIGSYKELYKELHHIRIRFNKFNKHNIDLDFYMDDIMDDHEIIDKAVGEIILYTDLVNNVIGKKLEPIVANFDKTNELLFKVIAKNNKNIKLTKLPHETWYEYVLRNSTYHPENEEEEEDEEEDEE
jgi:hypothetical protein